MTQSSDIKDAAQGALITATSARSFCGEWGAFSERFSNRISGREPSIYSLPLQLVESLRAKLPNWLTAKDLAFEEEFADLCGRYHVVGVAEVQMESPAASLSLKSIRRHKNHNPILK